MAVAVGDRSQEYLALTLLGSQNLSSRPKEGIGVALLFGERRGPNWERGILPLAMDERDFVEQK